MTARTSIAAMSVVLALWVHAQPNFMRTLQLPYPVAIQGSAVTPDGGLILCGSAIVGLETKGLLVRVDATGNVLWSKIYSGLGIEEVGSFFTPYDFIRYHDVTNGPDSSLLVVGYAGTTTGFLNPGRLIAAFDAAGDTLFAKGGEVIHFSSYSVILPFSTGTYLTGGTYGTLNTSVAFMTSFDLGTQLFPAGLDHTTGYYASLSDAVAGLEGGAIGSGVSNLTTPSAFLFKTDADLVELWNSRFSVPGWIGFGPAKVAEAQDSAIYLATSCGGGCSGSEPFILVRYAPDGTQVWSRSIALPTNVQVADVMMRGNGRVLVAGSAFQTSVTDSAYAWLMQFRADGGLDWAQRYGALDDTVAVSAMEMAADGSGYYLIGTSGVGGALVLKVDTMGALASCTFPALAPSVTPATLTPMAGVNNSPGGGGASSRFSPTPGVLYGLDQFTCAGSASPFSATGTVFGDIDQDGFLGPDESGWPWALVSASPNGWLFGNSSGDYLLAPDQPGTYTLATSAPAPWWALSSDSAAYHPTFTATDTLFEDLDFGYTAVIDTTILLGSFTSSPVRCTGQILQYINLLNQGSTTPQGVVALELDSLLLFIASVPAPDSIVDHTYYWHFDSLGFYQQWSAQLTLNAPGFAAIGDSLHDNLLVYADDGFGNLTLVGSDPWLGIVTCAYDPNDKLVSPAGTGPNNVTPADTEWLTYTVRFQNTGTDTAFVVVIEDQLSQHLQWSTLQFLGASHALTGLSIGALGKATFRFDNIQLPDSNVNETGSHGFVKFRIRMVQGLQHLTVIENNAGIFFDLNPPVITNTTLNTLVDCATATWTVNVFDQGTNDLYAYTFFMDAMAYTYQWYLNDTLIPGATEALYIALENGAYSAALTDTYGCTRVSAEVDVIVTGISEEQGTRMSVHPNPFTDRALIRCNELIDTGTRVDLVDVHGRVVRSTQGNGTHQLFIERGDLPGGIYVVRLWREDGAHSAVRILVQ